MAEVGCGSWLGLVFRLWLKLVVGCRRSPMFESSEVMARLAWVTAWLAGSSGFPMGFFKFFLL